MEGGYQVVRVRLRTETGTIVYVDLGHGEASVLASRIGRLAYGVRESNSRLAEAAKVWPQEGSLDEKLVAMLRGSSGPWTEKRFERGVHALGIELQPLEALEMMRELAGHGVLREVGIDTYRVVP